MNGILYGIGVGPGDPELMTLKAIKTIEKCHIIALPAKTKEDCLAYQIAKPVSKVSEKPLLFLDMPMTKDKQTLQKKHDEAASKVASFLMAGKNIGFLTLGDPTIYSTYLYIHNRIVAQGFETQIINGIPSFCAAAAALNTGLVENKQPLQILPASYEMDGFLPLPGTKVLMKSGKQLPQVKNALKDARLSVSMVENCGLPSEKKYQNLSELPDDSGYFSLIIAR